MKLMVVEIIKTYQPKHEQYKHVTLKTPLVRKIEAQEKALEEYLKERDKENLYKKAFNQMFGEDNPVEQLEKIIVKTFGK